MFRDSAINLDEIRMLFLTKPTVTAAMFTSVRVDFGRPTLSSSTSSLPSRNRDYHLKKFDQFTATFPYAFHTNTSVSVADRPVLKKKFVWQFPVHFRHP
jgi:hypothetical protein